MTSILVGPVHSKMWIPVLKVQEQLFLKKLAEFNPVPSFQWWQDNDEGQLDGEIIFKTGPIKFLHLFAGFVCFTSICLLILHFLCICGGFSIQFDVINN